MDTIALCEEPVKKLYASYLLPTLIAMASSSMYVLADVYFVSKGSGSNGLAALNIALPIFTLYSAIGLTFGVGSATLISIAQGTKNEELKNKAFTLSIVIMIIFGSVITIFGNVFIEQFAYLLGSSEKLLPFVKTYMIPVNSCAIAYILMYASSILLRADHAPALAMKSILISNVANIILDYVFVDIFKMGLFGASFATSIAPFIALACILPYFLRKRNTVHFVRSFYQKDIMYRMCIIGVGSGILEISAGAVTILFNIVILTYSDEVFLAAFAIVANIAYVCKGLMNGFAQAAQPIISVNYGAHHMHRVKQGIYIALTYSILFSIALYCIFLIFPQGVASIFANGDRTLIEVASKGIRYYFSSLICMAAMTCLLYYFQAIERGKIAIVLALCKGVIFVIIGMLLFLWLFQMDGIWWCITFAEGCALFLAFWFFKRVDNVC